MPQVATCCELLREAGRASGGRLAELAAGVAELREGLAPSTSASGLTAALADLADPLAPTQGHGLIALGRLLRDQDEETLAQLPSLLPTLIGSPSQQSVVTSGSFNSRILQRS